MITVGNRSTGLLATGSYLPAQVVTNQEVGEPAGVTDEWITRKTGIRHRRRAKPDEATSDMAIMAGRAALEAAGIKASKLSLVVIATSTPDSPQPPTACTVADELGARPGTAAFDINVVCSGFVFALTVAERLLPENGSAYALVIGSDIYSRILNPADRRTAILFGDGAGAAVIGPEGKHRILVSRLASYGAQRDLIRVPAGGSRIPASADTIDEGLHYFAMDGRGVRDFVHQQVSAEILDFLAMAGVSPEQVAHFIPHQANGRMIEELNDALGIPWHCTATTYEEYGNTGSASVAITLDHAARSGALNRSDLVLLAGFGGGMSVGLTLLRW